MALVLLAAPTPAWALNNSFPAAGDTVMCSGRPWIDVICNGADPTDTADSTSAIQTTINTAAANGWPVFIPAGSYRVSAEITIDYAGQASKGFRLISAGATLDGRSIPSGPVLQVQCGGGTPSSPAACFYFHEEGTLLIEGDSGAVNLATLTAGYSAGATTLSVSTTSGFYVSGTVDVALSNGGSFASAVTAIGAGTITLATGLPSSANNGAQVSRPSYVFALGKIDFSDQHNSLKIDHLSVNNASTAPGAGACQFNAVYDSDIYAVCDSAGGAAGIALEEVQFSHLAGAGSATATGGAALVLEQGYNFSNTFTGLDLENAPTCLSITDAHHGDNTFISPYFNCTTAVSATASDNNLLVNPQYAGAVVNYGPQSVGISILGLGSRAKWMFPAAASYAAAPIDDGLAISSYNASGTSLGVTLPPIAAVNPGWSMGFATDNGKGLTVTAPTGMIVSGGKSLSSLTLGGGNYEYVALESDSNNWRVRSATRGTRLNMGLSPPPWPANWLFPSTAGYAATLADNGNILSSYNTAAGLAVTLPATTGLPTGWSMGFATDNDKTLTVAVNGSSGGHIVYPGSGAVQNSLTLANTSQGAYEFLVLQYDGGGNFRVVEASPATLQGLGTIGSASLSHWSFPAAGAYQASVADNGNVVSSFNSPLSYMAVTLPSATGALPMGWTIGIASDSGKTTSVTVNGSSGGHILYPGSGATATSVTLAAGDYELLVLRYDGSNFRVTEVTPATATLIGMTGAAPGVNRWNFPTVTTYSATQSDSGNALSSYNAAGGLTVTLPETTAIKPGWIMGFASDNGNSMTVSVNATSGGQIVKPARGGIARSSLALAAGQNYEYAVLQFDGSNFRVVEITPQTLNDEGGLITPGTPASSGATCNTGQLQADSNYLYFCTAPNTWKRAALSSF
ncbi:MAG TPA: glycosyl hydrolase family 28-related protein [Stellaceae bacterium]|nr:glycosyl hydrolase family 28-related protein [Stellaceae bacterium]